MGLLCCGKKAPIVPSPSAPSPPRVVPKLARRRSAPRPRASKQNIEEFYREGKELLRAEQEEQERSQLRAALKLEYDRDLVYDDDAQQINGPIQFGTTSSDTERAESGPSGVRSGPDSMFKSASNRYSFETATDRTGVRGKAAAYTGSKRTELLAKSNTPGSDENLPCQYENSQAVETLGISTSTRPHSKGKERATPIPTSSNPYQTPSTAAFASADDSIYNLRNGLNTGESTSGYQTPVDFLRPGTSRLEDPEGQVTPKVSMMLQSPEVSHAGLSRSGTLMRELPKIDTDMIRAAAANKGDNRALARGELGFPSEEIFARLPNLLKPSTSTFFGSSTSHVGKRDLSSPASDDTALHHRFSQQSLQQGLPSKKPSKGTLFVASTHQRLDSASSFYPSLEGSQCQSLQESLVDIPNAVGFASSHATTMPRMYSRRSIDRLHRARSISSFSGAEDSPGYSRFNFPWNGANGGGSPARTLVRAGSIAEILPEEDVEAPKRSIHQLDIVPVRSERKSGAIKPQQRSSSSRALTGMFNFVKSGVTGGEYSSSVSSGLQSPESFDTRGSTATDTAGSTVTPGQYVTHRSGTPRAIKPRMSWYSKQGSSKIMFPNSEDQALRRTISFREKPSGLRQVDTGAEDSLGRFDHIGDTGIARSRSLTLRKSFTISMAKIREKVSIGGFRNAPQPKGNEYEKQMTSKKTWETPRPGTGMNNIQSKPALPRDVVTISSRGKASDDNSSGNGNAILRRANTAKTLPSRSPSAAARSMYNKRRSTTYDDCVIFPFADGGDDRGQGEFIYGNTEGTFWSSNYQAEEYESERRFWNGYSASSTELCSRKASIGTAH